MFPGVLTYNFGTDGAPTNPNSSIKSFWPSEVILNELPLKLRFKNVLIPLLWVTKCEPTVTFMNLYMSNFIEMAYRLKTKGVTIQHWKTGEAVVLKFVPLCVCVDSVARPIMQAHVQFNGYGGCGWCEINRLHDRSMRYPLSEIEDKLRTHESNLKDMKIVMKSCRFVNGVKGMSALATDLPCFDSICNYGFEYMHNGTLGIPKQIHEHLTTPSFWTDLEESFCLTPTSRQEINERLRRIRPTIEIHRLPRPLTEKSKWKATEWRSWTLFYLLPCLKGILEEKALKSLLLFSRSLHTLLKDEITDKELMEVEKDILTFVGETNVLYGIHVMRYNMHILLHMVRSSQKCSRIKSTSVFPYENGIFTCKRLVKGSKNVASERATKWLRKCSLNESISRFSMRETCTSYCENFITLKNLTPE